VKTVADTLGVSRSQLQARLREASRPRGRYQKSEDAELLSAIRTLTDDCPTYGYRRIWALLNRQREQAGQPRLNHKRIYRLMSQNKLLLQRYTGKPPGRAHDGQIITIRPNLRWTSDGFEIACWNGQIVRVAFALDTCDREVMSWIATTGGISGEMIRDLMLESVERRFANRALPQSSGMAESFVKTFKRDYVYVHDRPDAQSVLAQLPRWLEDYNENHPHKALRMKSPREFIRSFHQPTADCAD
jgi:transposase InsO family protein